MIRTFIALDLPPAIHQAIERLSLELQRTQAAVSWVKPGRMHLTLKFLGDVQPEKIGEISTALERVTSNTLPFRIRPVGCGAFPSTKQMRVVWVGLQGDLDPLKRLQQDLEDAMASSGFERETRSFKPHLTLGRVRGRQNLHALQEALLANQSFEAELLTSPNLYCIRVI